MSEQHKQQAIGLHFVYRQILPPKDDLAKFPPRQLLAKWRKQRLRLGEWAHHIVEQGEQLPHEALPTGRVLLLKILVNRVYRVKKALGETDG